MVNFFKKHMCKGNKAGFTVIEVMVVVAIICMILAIVIPNLPQEKIQLSLAQVSYAFQQNLRRVQTMALSSPQFNGQNVTGYGIYVNTATPGSYIIYANTGSSSQGYVAGSDPIVQTVTLPAGIIISQINTGASNTTNTTASIAYATPTGATTITTSPTADANQNPVSVVISNANNPAQNQPISCNSAGLCQAGTAIAAYVCGSPSDCGTNGLSGNFYCSGQNVMQNYFTYTCNSPNTAGANCSNVSTPTITSTCSGSQPLCNSNGNGTGNAGCVACNVPADCGNSGLAGGDFCQNGNVYENNTTYTCNNPTTTAATCTSSTVAQLQTTCTGSQTCLNGSCSNAHITCGSPSDCGTSGFTGSPFCSGTLGGSIYQNYITYTCNNHGTANSSCSSSTTAQLKQSCAGGSGYGCLNGVCVSIIR